jgi:RimJ/RimL family protein N-acetyltransferase
MGPPFINAHNGLTPVRSVSNVTVERPFPAWALPRLWEWMQSFRTRVADDFAPDDFDSFLGYWKAREAVSRTWGVWRGEDGDREIGGLVSITPVNPVSAETHVIFSKRFFGRDTTVPALRAVYGREFREHPELATIAAHVFEDNRQLLAIAREVGAVQETRQPLRARTRRNGQLVGFHVISLYREVFQ